MPVPIAVEGDKAITLASDDFELFGVARRFKQDRDALDARWNCSAAPKAITNSCTPTNTST